MAISTNSIIHYTKNLETLCLIFKEGFKVHYCLEKIITAEKGFLQTALPMVSFCDIPLSQVKKHIDSYGKYGIGLKKKWAKEKRLNPVLYFEQNSELIDFVRTEFEKFAKNGNISGECGTLMKILSYSKNYEANLEIGGETQCDYRFYDEKEWRFVPSIKSLSKANQWIRAKEFMLNKQKFHDTLAHIRLTFNPGDVSYIIVNNESDIKEITGLVRAIYSDKCTMQELEILMSRILTTDQILNDF